MTWWNPTSLSLTKGLVNPFESFDTWEDFLSHYTTDENEIIREGGPGDAIQAGEWYLTTTDEKPIDKHSEYAEWFLSYVRSSSGTISFVKLFRDTPLIPNEPKPWKWHWDSGDRDGWGSHKFHYKVDFAQSKMSWDFINWNSNPFISFK